MNSRWWLLAFTFALVAFSSAAADAVADDDLPTETVDNDLGSQRDGSKTDSEVVGREEQAIKLDGLSVAEMKELRDKAEKHHFQVSGIYVGRMKEHYNWRFKFHGIDCFRILEICDPHR